MPVDFQGNYFYLSFYVKGGYITDSSQSTFSQRIDINSMAGLRGVILEYLFLPPTINVLLLLILAMPWLLLNRNTTLVNRSKISTLYETAIITVIVFGFCSFILVEWKAIFWSLLILVLLFLQDKRIEEKLNSKTALTQFLSENQNTRLKASIFRILPRSVIRAFFWGFVISAFYVILTYILPLRMPSFDLAELLYPITDGLLFSMGAQETNGLILGTIICILIATAYNVNISVGLAIGYGVGLPLALVALENHFPYATFLGHFTWFAILASFTVIIRIILVWFETKFSRTKRNIR